MHARARALARSRTSTRFIDMEKLELQLSSCLFLGRALGRSRAMKMGWVFARERVLAPLNLKHDACKCIHVVVAAAFHERKKMCEAIVKCMEREKKKKEFGAGSKSTSWGHKTIEIRMRVYELTYEL